MIPNCRGITKRSDDSTENREEDLMDDKTMTNEENYRFDVAGYMIVPGVLTVAETERLQSGTGPASV